MAGNSFFHDVSFCGKRSLASCAYHYYTMDMRCCQFGNSPKASLFFLLILHEYDIIAAVMPAGRATTQKKLFK
jgi:hypothetical protein